MPDDIPFDDPVMATPEAAEYIGVSHGTLRNLVSQGRAPRSCGQGSTVGRPTLFKQSALDAWLAHRSLVRSVQNAAPYVGADELYAAAAAMGIRP